ncbi:MAG TPA: hypothetical protein VG714_10075 [Acidobacteriaceae bacterium]|nr:hypothetical protein [Acidobacteriaceae bacterium]
MKQKKPWRKPALQITEGTGCRFFHRQTSDFKFESVCLHCHLVVGIRDRESRLRFDEKRHTCGVPSQIAS